MRACRRGSSAIRWSILKYFGFTPDHYWARLIQKIYQVDPLTCQKGQGQMRIISFIEDQEVIKTILKHRGLWLVKRTPRPRVDTLLRLPLEAVRQALFSPVESNPFLALKASSRLLHPGRKPSGLV